MNCQADAEGDKFVLTHINDKQPSDDNSQDKDQDVNESKDVALDEETCISDSRDDK